MSHNHMTYQIDNKTLRRHQYERHFAKLPSSCGPTYLALFGCLRQAKGSTSKCTSLWSAARLCEKENKQQAKWRQNTPLLQEFCKYVERYGMDPTLAKPWSKFV
eukprot:NODE_2516_length_521_cov_192.597458_g1997_i0.p2 GENE.NODE_2516_length_521_cov_192.597458_g1997_i0~~NODE_2516_length_521_cov_192.597458_g1997_i0.p2  ORF type:complete len:104 (+),score=17.00 NODE_2516_length_521_cov_192.597458_g1997_i0:77-388(+)